MLEKSKKQYCFNCGEYLGEYDHYYGDEPECCGSSECLRELRDMLAAEEDERRYRAEEDNYDRYSY